MTWVGVILNVVIPYILVPTLMWIFLDWATYRDEDQNR